MKKICGKKLKIFFGFLLFLVLGIFSVPSAKANLVFESTKRGDSENGANSFRTYPTSFGWHHDTTEGNTDDCILIVGVVGQFNTGGLSYTATYNGNSMSVLYTPPSNYNREFIFYQINPAIGDYDINITMSSWNYGVGQSYYFCGVDTANIFDYLNYFENTAKSSPYNYNLDINATSSSVLLFIGSSPSSNTMTASTSETFIEDDKAVGQNGHIFSSWVIKDNGNYQSQWIGSASNQTTLGYIYLPSVYVPPSEYCGDSICNGEETFNTCPQDCLLPTGDYALHFSNQQSNAPQCDLPIRYDSQYSNDTKNDIINVYECFEGDCGNKTWVASTTVVNEYSIIVDSINQGGILIPPPATSGNYVYEAISAGVVYHFFIFWGSSCNNIDYINSNLYTGGGYFNNGSATTTFSTTSAAFNLNTRTIACSEEEWNSSSSFLGINGTLIRCQTTTGMLNIGQGFINMIKSAINGVLNGIKSLFPVNLIVGLTEAWNTSASSTLPADMAWLTNEVDPTTGNITINPGEAFASSTGLAISGDPIVIWGQDMGGDDPMWTEWRLRIRAILGWLIWGAWVWFQIIERAKRIYSYL